jgi:hypothetical protein
MWNVRTDHMWNGMYRVLWPLLNLAYYRIVTQIGDGWWDMREAIEDWDQ